MMHRNPFENPGYFLERYWQKEPCLIRQALPAFKPSIDANDLAGLACEELAQARIVRGSFKERNWQVDYGPFAESTFSGLPDENWTLLVQDVEKHYAPLQALLQKFDFVPSWRLDDLMISYAVAGGSVGPHTDQYDVFLLQAKGRRRWQISRSYEPQWLEDCPLRVLKNFSPQQQWVLEPGDMLYLPPNVAHYGVALDAGMTWSVGLRAPSMADLLQGFGEWLAFSADEGGRYSDPVIEPKVRKGEISRQTLADMRGLMQKSICNDSAGTDRFIASFLSRFRLALDPQSPPENIDPRTVANALQNGSRLLANPWTRLSWIESTKGASLYAAGQHYHCSVELAETLCGASPVNFRTMVLDEASLTILTSLINGGHFVLSTTGLQN